MKHYKELFMCLILAQHLVSKILINIRGIQQLADRDNLDTQDYAIILGKDLAENNH